MEFLTIMLAVLGIILLIVLIVLSVKLYFTVSRINILLDDLERKMKTVNRVFNVVDKVSDFVSLVSDRMIDTIVGIISKLFTRKDKKIEKEKEEEF